MKLIKREEIDYNGDTYNLHIENDHNYIAMVQLQLLYQNFFRKCVLMLN